MYLKFFFLLDAYYAGFTHVASVANANIDHSFQTTVITLLSCEFHKGRYFYMPRVSSVKKAK